MRRTTKDSAFSEALVARFSLSGVLGVAPFMVSHNWILEQNMVGKIAKKTGQQAI